MTKSNKEDPTKSFSEMGGGDSHYQFMSGTCSIKDELFAEAGAASASMQPVMQLKREMTA